MKVGDRVWTGVRRKTWKTAKRHVAVVDHHYDFGALTWVVPVCGAPAGRAENDTTAKVCARCQAIERKDGR